MFYLNLIVHIKFLGPTLKRMNNSFVLFPFGINESYSVENIAHDEH